MSQTCLGILNSGGLLPRGLNTGKKELFWKLLPACLLCSFPASGVSGFETTICLLAGWRAWVVWGGYLTTWILFWLGVYPAII